MLSSLADKGIAIRVASPKLVMEEVSEHIAMRVCILSVYFHVWFHSQAPESYKNVTDVVDTCKLIFNNCCTCIY